MKEEIEFPFKRLISLEYLLGYLKSQVDEEGSFIKNIYNEMEVELGKIPELFVPTEDLEIVKKHKEVLRLLLSIAIPTLEEENKIYMVAKPFSKDFIYKSDYIKNLKVVNQKISTYDQIIYVYIIILNKYYDMDINYSMTNIHEVIDLKTKKKKYFQMVMNINYMKVKKVNNSIPEITEEQKKEIMDDLDNLEFLMKILPPENFKIEGIEILEGVDVTGQEVLSKITKELLDNNSLFSSGKINRLKENISNYMEIKDININLAGLKNGSIFMINSGDKLHGDCINENSKKFNVNFFEGTFINDVISNEKAILFRDIREIKGEDKLRDFMIGKNEVNAYMAPIVSNGELEGFIQFTTGIPGEINIINSKKLDEIIPFFASALTMALDLFESRVKNLIQDKFTSIHKSVEWSFREAAIKYMDEKERGGKETDLDISKISFEKTYPFYGISDIRASSNNRNLAIKKDIIFQLNSSKKILEKIYQLKELPLIDKTIYRIKKEIKNIDEKLVSGDEIKIVKFIKKDVEFFLMNYKNLTTEISDMVDKYYDGIDAETGSAYNMRKKFDTSVIKINKIITQKLEKAQKEAQSMFPHYFDKQVTDGVDHTMYIGKEMSGDYKFNPIYIKNLRLWQLLVMCEIAKELELKVDELPIKLRVTHLIAVQDMPMSIFFDRDEKRFKVEGAYNIRYEIMKKRIDKAIVKGTGERATQPGKITVIYSQDSEKKEYKEYFDYLVAKKYIDSNIEKFDIEDLQGIAGLKGMRVMVNLNDNISEKTIIEKVKGHFSK